VPKSPYQLVEPEAQAALEMPPPEAKKKIKLPSYIIVIKAVMTMVGVTAVVLSTMYTYRFLLPTNGSVVSFLLSFSMIVFSVISFDVVILFWKPRHHALSITFAILWVIVASFSMFSTMEVNYNGYVALEEASVEDFSGRVSVRLSIAALERRIEDKKTQVASIQDGIKSYTEKTATVSAWYLGEFQKGLSAASKELQDLYAELDVLIKESPEALVTEETKKVTFYDSIEKIFKVPAKSVHFFIHLLPAVFIDIMAPFSIAVAIFLGKGKEE
jgi:hypothetical protein